MLINKKNDLYYDTQNFDKYNNYYVILDLYKIKLDTSESQNRKLYINTLREQLIIRFNDIIHKNRFKIGIGHFYNNSDFFLYKDVNNGQTIKYKIKKCLRDNLYFNEHNNVVCSNSYAIIKKQLQYLNNKETDFNSQLYNPLTEITYSELDETLGMNANESYVSYIYSNECLEIIINTGNIIINL